MYKINNVVYALLLVASCSSAIGGVQLHSFEPRRIEKDFGNMIHTTSVGLDRHSPQL